MWHHLRPSGRPPAARASHCACLLPPSAAAPAGAAHGTMFVCGGRVEGGGCADDVQLLALPSLRWSQPRVRAGPRPALWGGACCVLPQPGDGREEEAVVIVWGGCRPRPGGSEWLGEPLLLAVETARRAKAKPPTVGVALPPPPTQEEEEQPEGTPEPGSRAYVEAVALARQAADEDGRAEGMSPQTRERIARQARSRPRPTSP